MGPGTRGVQGEEARFRWSGSANAEDLAGASLICAGFGGWCWGGKGLLGREGLVGVLL